jgi:cardiolipin synthase
MLCGMSVHGLRPARVQTLTNGIEAYEKLAESLQQAQRTIDLEYYIYRDDEIGRRITDLLVERAAAGVRVRFLRDGWGSRQFPRRQMKRMSDAGIACRTIFPLRFPWVLSNLIYRDHCKIVVIDGKEAFTGGINIGYEYTGLKPDVGFWRDTHVRIVGEEAAADLQAVFDAHWNIASPEWVKTWRHWNTPAKDKRKSINQGTRPRSQNMAPSGNAALSGWSAEWGAELGAMDNAGTVPGKETLHKAYVQTLEGNPGMPTQVIRQAYFICLTQAARTIDIATPYFVPDADIIMAIKTAAARGVRVRMLVPRRVVPQIAGPASRTYYGELLEAGVQIYLYDKGILHAKLMIVDGEIAEVGAANYDMRSFRLDYEVCEVIYSDDVARELTEQFERDLAASAPLRMEELLQRSVAQRTLEQAARLLAPLL